MKNNYTDKELVEMLIIRRMREKGISRDKAEEELIEELKLWLRKAKEAAERLKKIGLL